MDLLSPENILPLIIAGLVFLTAITVIAPFFEQQTIKKKADLVTTEREQMRARQKAEMKQQNKAASLRGEKPEGLARQIVDALNLKSLLEGDAAREKLRRAGYRTEKHLVSYLAARVIAPIVMGIVVYVYVGALPNKVEPMMRLVAALAGAGFGFYLPAIIVTNRITKRQESIKLAWSDALDLMLICVESGMSIEQALHKVSAEIASSSVPLAEELQYTLAELSYLGDRTAAFVNLAKRTGLPTVKAVTTALIQSEKHGTPLGHSLRVLAEENRNDRMAELEKKAAALPPKLTVPMIMFFLPVIFIVVLGPAIINVTSKWNM